MNATHATRQFVRRYAPKWIRHAVNYVLSRRLLVVTWPIRFNEDELITSHYPDFMADERFVEIYNRACADGLEALKGSGFYWKSHVITWAAAYALQLKGDFVECGVNKGFHSKIVVDFVEFNTYTDRRFYLLDTYEGFVLDSLTPFELQLYNRSTVYGPCYERVKQIFSAYPNVEIIKGPIPETLPLVPAANIAYLSIDLNCVNPEIAAANFFWPKLVHGGIIILDDYGHTSHEEQRRAFNEFARTRGTRVLCLPTGQGLIIKT